MGSTNSHMQPPLLDHQLAPIMHEPSTYQPQYPDMNQIFKGIPKMMQVADDMHRMTNYIQDLRNMLFFCSVLSALGLMMFLLLRFMQNRKTTKRRRPANNPRTGDDSEQSSLSISRPNNYRHYHSSRPVDNWTHKIEMDRMLALPESTSTRQTNMSGHAANHGIMLNNRMAAALGPSPDHHASHPQQLYQQQQSPHHHLDGQPAGPSTGAHSNQISPCPTPTSTSGGHNAIVALGHPPHVQPNGQLKVAH